MTKKRIYPHRIATIAASLLLIVFATPACAQYVWRDNNNIVNYSDRPPPSSVPSKRILKAPREHNWAEELYQEPENTPTLKESSKEPTTAEREAAYKKRKEERVERERKASEARRRTKAKARYCARTREHQRTLNSGMRMARAGKNGERSIMSDAQRAQEQQEIKRMLAKCK